MTRFTIQRAIEDGRAFIIRNGKRFDVLTIGDDGPESPSPLGQAIAWLSGSRASRIFESLVSLDEIQIA